ncbi:MAG TPA: OmpA family protein [Bacteroidales bacterium]|nr:OmpA family protein [Bacteroidales bacterium]HSA43314.1 OmpA family protein [Bacteroidales bacterium]
MVAKYLTLPLLVLLLLHQEVISQNVEFKASQFKDRKEAFRLAEAQLEAGNISYKEALKAMDEGKNPVPAFTDALGSFLKANAFNPDNAELNYRIGKCMFYTGQEITAIDHLKKALSLNEKDCQPDVHWLLGSALKLNYRFDEAKAQFILYKSKEKEKIISGMAAELNRDIQQCETARLMVEKPLERVWVEAVKDWNTDADEYAPSITADESMLVFNRSQAAEPGSVKVLVTNREKGRWSLPKAFGAPYDPEGTYESFAVSYDGQALYMGKQGSDKDIFVSKLDGRNWTSPLRLPDKINSPSDESGACFTPDGIKIYYVTEHTYGNKGGKDLFFSGVMDRKQNIWGEGMTIGSELNTPWDDAFIYLHPDDKTIFFASKGHNGMGGYDIYKTTRLAGRWSTPENLGYPVNTPWDETSYVLSASGKRAYVTSNRPESSKGGYDIFRITYLGPVKQPQAAYEDQLLADVAAPQRDDKLKGMVDVESKNLTILKGRTLDDFTSQPVGATIDIIDNLKNAVIATFTSNSISGKFLVSLPAGFNYGIAVNAKDYLFHSENFNLPQTSPYQMVEKEIRLKGACLGCKIILKNIFFDTGKFVLRPESFNELDRLADLIRDLSRVKPGIKIEISGHTDNVGSESSNMTLSENRAKAVVKYLTDKGIGANRLVYKGYGPSQPVASNATADGRQENRRTEFKIIGE